MEFREAIERDAQDLRELTDRVIATTGHGQTCKDMLSGLTSRGRDYREQERRLEAAAMQLRRTWLSLAHRPADAILKSPREGQSARVPCGDSVRFGYERDLDVSILEDRGHMYVRPPAKWSSEVVLYRAGQAALAGILQFVVSRWGQSGPLTVAQAGSYFETASLLESWPSRILQPASPLPEDSVDVLITEPVSCDGRFACSTSPPHIRRVHVFDTTMVGPGHDLARHLAGCSLAIAYSSGLKLDQAGLELANVGIVRVLTRDGGDDDAATIARSLRRIRALNGSGLTLDELSALSAPWFMDRTYVDHYTDAVFANNAALAAAVDTRSAVFGERCHPSLAAPRATAPFCALELREASPANYRRLVQIVEQQCDRRGLLAARGGSFGFRGHRFELIEPEPGRGSSFLRVAMGWRAGHSCRGLCDLFGELAACTSFAALERGYGR